MRRILLEIRRESVHFLFIHLPSIRLEFEQIHLASDAASLVVVLVCIEMEETEGGKALHSSEQ
jgi:hypothetical protein